MKNKNIFPFINKNVTVFTIWDTIIAGKITEVQGNFVTILENESETTIKGFNIRKIKERDTQNIGMK